MKNPIYAQDLFDENSEIVFDCNVDPPEIIGNILHEKESFIARSSISKKIAFWNTKKAATLFLVNQKKIRLKQIHANDEQYSLF